ncbi:hypothetical protein [Chitinophaga rhizophila]|uniref:Lipoprotein n=1 Tax=Chitinophaga rhizophila TaxID=2866212 RepID=A0ABS7G6V1_9BACT|nr:hypothetical protein [Chitinophaga rhizophila]MBW8683374.1 hypothetical protein [Chitinophaga rhizophila]
MFKMVFRLILLGCLLSCKLSETELSTDTNEGVFIISSSFRHPVTGKMVPYFPDDSVFCSGSSGIEKVTKTNQVIIEDKLASSQDEPDTYFLIDFEKQYFAEVKDLQNISKAISINKPFSSPKKLGMEFNTTFYNKEPYTSVDTTIGGTKYTLIRYQSTLDEFKGANMSLYLTPMPKGSITIFPRMEGFFKARFARLEVTTLKGEEVNLQLTFQPGLSNYWKSIFKKLS